MKTIAKLNKQDREVQVNKCMTVIAEYDEAIRLNAELLSSLESLVNWTYNQSAPLEDIREQAKQLIAQAKGGAR